MRIETAIPIDEQLLRVAFGEGYRGGLHQPIRAVSTDTRTLRRGDLFFALEGEHKSGEAFVKDAMALGAYTISTRYKDATVNFPDTEKALLTLANAYKSMVAPKFTIAVTGSVGKSTVKDMLYHLVGKRFRAHATYGNLNSTIGVPLTVFSMPPTTEIAIFEAGMNHAGELSRIAECIRPDIAVITKIGTAHIGNLGSREAIASAKCEILSHGSPMLFKPYGEKLLNNIPGKTVSCSSNEADYALLQASEKVYEFHSERQGFRVNVDLPLGAHTPECLAFALAVCDALGMNESEIIEALPEISNIERGIRMTTIGDAFILDDSYNASYESVISALSTLGRHSGRRVAVLGDILELGNESKYIHEAVGKACVKHGVDELYTFGTLANDIAVGAVNEGFDRNNVYINPDLSDPGKTAKAISDNSRPGDMILFKASHKTDIYRIIAELKRLSEV